MPKTTELDELDYSGNESNLSHRNFLNRVGCVTQSTVVTSLNPSTVSGTTSGSSSGAGCISSPSKKYRHQNYSKNIYIGTKNAEKWDLTRQRLAFKNDVEFVTYLLRLAESDTDKNNSGNSPHSAAPKSIGRFNLDRNSVTKDISNSQSGNGEYLPSARKPTKRVQFQDSFNNFMKSKEYSSFALKHKKHDPQDQSISSSLDDNNVAEVLDCRIAEKIQNELEQKSANGAENCTNNVSMSKEAICLKTSKPIYRSHDSDESCNDEEEEEDDVEEEEEEEEEDEEEEEEENDDCEDTNDSQNKDFRPSDGVQKLSDIRKAPLNGKSSKKKCDDSVTDSSKLIGGESDEEINHLVQEDKVRAKQSCRECTILHKYEECPYSISTEHLPDSVQLDVWRDRNMQQNTENLIDNNESYYDDDSTSSLENIELLRKQKTKPVTFSEISLPPQLEIRNLNHGVFGVFARVEFQKYTRFGPLIGETILPINIHDDCNMENIYEIYVGAKSEFISMENPNSCNWIRYVRPAPTYEERNTNLICIEKKIFLVTSTDIYIGCELLYWSDECNSAWQKKHINKTSCGGCNIQFLHPLHYRTHCSIFHDPSFSLTIRKYHCKICGDVVLGKENIMQHASQMHEGKGAYQCQFCEKFFLRLNYLEMHRTYGCSSNPQRARPLCDFCGRKFCQPQKLKVHIKRMHSNIADVLKDFQCKLCSKLLGSRAALQRHSKEVHSRNSTVVSCPRCQKLFQNRSNLKIHMLTHSGVRPFKCAENECRAAFTTKQCLQFHYKKVHNYTQDQMPKIERSVAYTFDAYSGGMKVDFLGKLKIKVYKGGFFALLLNCSHPQFFQFPLGFLNICDRI